MPLKSPFKMFLKICFINTNIIVKLNMLNCSVNYTVLHCTVLQLIAVLYTGLPTKDETSETIVRNLHCLFPYIHNSQYNYKLLFFFAKNIE